MAAKENEIPSYAELHDLYSRSLKGQVSIDCAVHDKLQKSSRRTTVIVGEVLLDNILRLCLTRHFSHNNETIGKLLDEPLGSLSNKATLAYALGLIDATTRGNLNHIYRIRCEFAHRFDVDFTDEKVLTLVAKIPRTKGQEKVTAENSFEFFITAMKRLVEYLVDVRKGISGNT